MLILPSQWSTAWIGRTAQYLLGQVPDYAQRSVAWALLIASLRLWMQTPRRPGDSIHLDADQMVARIDSIDFCLARPSDGDPVQHRERIRGSGNALVLIYPARAGEQARDSPHAGPDVHVRVLDEWLNWRVYAAAIDCGHTMQATVRNLLQLYNDEVAPEHQIDLGHAGF